MLLSTILIFSFFNPKMDDSKRNDLEVKSIAIQWYNLFLKLESKDIKAFPPISSQRLANLGMSGYLTMDYQKTMSLSDAETLALLNKVYSNSLKKYFKHLDSNSFNNIAKLENSISASISIASSSENIIEKASENLINNDLNSVLLFKKASLKGWEYAYSNIEESSELIYRKYNSQNLTKNELIYEGKELKKLSYFNTANLGEIKKEKIQRIYDLYNLMGLISSPIDLGKFVFDLDATLFRDFMNYLNGLKITSMI